MRLKYIDSAKGFAMLLIVWGHTVSFYDPIAHWASAFKISLFYIATGLLLSFRSEAGIAVKTPVKKLLLASGIPYAFYSLLSLCAAAVVMIIQNRDPAFLMEKIIFTVTLNGVSTLWFLPSIFFGRLLFERFMCRRLPALMKIVIATILPILLVLAGELISASAFSYIIKSVLVIVLKVLVAFWFICAGFTVGPLMSGRENNRVKDFSMSAVLLICGSAVAFANRGVDLNNGSFGSHPLFFFLSGVLCSFGIIGVFACICEKLPCRVTEFVGKNSLFIMVTHLPLYIVPIVFSVVAAIFKGDGIGFDYLRAGITFALVLIVEWVLISVKRKLSVKFRNGRIGKLLSYI